MDGRNALLGNSGFITQSEGEEVNLKAVFPEIIGRSQAIQNLLRIVHKAAQTDSSVLIYGESGTGKELIASALHRLSPRAINRFIPINCSAIPESLLESELFGHEKGAFTGAGSKRIGRFEAAHEGTIFLDEIGDMPLSLQAKLLRVLQEKQLTPIGSSQLLDINVRVIAATNLDLEEAVKDNQFRLDLFYRLNVLPIVLPPLREREGDVVMLVEHFLDLMNRRYPAKKPCHFSPEALHLLEHYAWPGNVRELQNVMERLVVISSGGLITKDQLPKEILNPKTPVSPPKEALPKEAPPLTSNLLPDQGIDLTEIMETLENSYILQALEKTNNNKNQAAKLLGLNRTTLVERIKKRNLAPLNQPSREL